MEILGTKRLVPKGFELGTTLSRPIPISNHILSFCPANKRLDYSSRHTRLLSAYFCKNAISAMASCLLFDFSYPRMVHHGFYFMMMYLIRVCLVFYFLLFQLLLYRSLQTLVIMHHECRKIMQVLNKIFFIFRSYSLLFILFPKSGRLPVYISVFLSLVEGDNVSQPVQETTPGNF